MNAVVSMYQREEESLVVVSNVDMEEEGHQGMIIETCAMEAKNVTEDHSVLTNRLLTANHALTRIEHAHYKLLESLHARFVKEKCYFCLFTKKCHIELRVLEKFQRDPLGHVDCDEKVVPCCFTCAKKRFGIDKKIYDSELMSQQFSSLKHWLEEHKALQKSHPILCEFQKKLSEGSHFYPDLLRKVCKIIKLFKRAKTDRNCQMWKDQLMWTFNHGNYVQCNDRLMRLLKGHYRETLPSVQNLIAVQKIIDHYVQSK
jgi:hypothetical protein